MIWINWIILKKENMAKKKFQNVYQFKIVLEGITPPIWRRIQVPENYTFWDLYVASIEVMGWGGGHLHDFSTIDSDYAAVERIKTPLPECEFDDEEEYYVERKEKISDWFGPGKNKKMRFTYDFGDNWDHLIILEDILPRENKTEYPICVKGKRACPPEDCGSIPGYYHLLDVMKNKKHKEYKELVEWLGGEPFNPEEFNVEEIGFSNPEEEWRFVEKTMAK